MSRFLTIDIGAGTMDVLYYDEGQDLSCKAVVRSPALLVAELAAGLPGRLLVWGTEMGGGNLASILKKRAQEGEVVMTRSAAATVHHNRERVKGLGIRIIEDDEAERYRRKGYSSLRLADIDPERLRRIVAGFGVPFEFDFVGICVQDHGVAPAGLSHLDYRHTLLRDALEDNPHPHAALYEKSEAPVALNRLRSVAAGCDDLPAAEFYLMDSGMAAILGASLDSHAVVKERILVLDIATSHTVGAALEAGELAGFFEYHTRDITRERIEGLLVDLAEGKLRHDQILSEGGHGAYTRKSVGFENCEVIVATGPKRKLMYSSQLPIVFGAPFGDNMMTGTTGLLEAIRRRKGMEPMVYL